MKNGPGVTGVMGSGIQSREINMNGWITIKGLLLIVIFGGIIAWYFWRF